MTGARVMPETTRQVAAQSAPSLPPPPDCVPFLANILDLDAKLQELTVPLADGAPLQHGTATTGGNSLSDGRKVYTCPCCGYIGKFLPFSRRLDVQCPQCKSLERHRMLCFQIAVRGLSANLSAGLVTPDRWLHFGPHPSVESGIMKVCQEARVDHVGVDFFAPGYERIYSKNTFHADVTSLSFPNAFFQNIIIAHVLEHIAEIEKAFDELHRVLSPGGHLIAEVPCRHNGATLDCRGMNSSLRAQLDKCMQWDHVWLWNCRDFAKGLVSRGFACEDTKCDEHGCDRVTRSGAPFALVARSARLESSHLQFCTKPVDLLGAQIGTSATPIIASR